MTLATSTRYKLYQPVVLTDEFIVPFPIFDTADLEVLVDGVVTVLWTITATLENGRSDDAVITLNTAVTNVDVEIYGKRTPRRDNSYLAGSPELAENLQRDIEATTAVQQEQARDFNRSLKLPVEDGIDYEIGENAAARANNYLAFDGSGNPIIAAGAAGVPVSTFMESVIAAANSSAAQTALGLGSMADQDADSVAITDGVVKSTFTDVVGTDIAVATELLVPLSGNYFTITGDGTVTSIETTADAIPFGREIDFMCTGTVTFTHHATNLICPGGVDAVFLPGQMGKLRKYASGDWRLSRVVEQYSGSWTPALDNDLHGPPTYVEQEGRYVRTGNMVYASFHVEISALNSAAAFAPRTITGLPFANATAPDVAATGAVGRLQGLNITAGETLVLHMWAGDDSVHLYISNVSTGHQGIANSEFTDNFEIYGSILYETDE